MTDPDPMKPTFPGDEIHPYQAPQQPPEKKPHGCFFYGCIISLILMVLIAIGLGLAIWYFVNAGNKLIDEYTDTAPQPIPAVELPAEERKALDERVETFKTDLEAKKAAEPLVLTSEQVNALLEEQPGLKGKVHVELEGDKIKGTVSMEMPADIGPFKLKGRYFNGEGTFTASLVDGAIDVRLEEAQVKGKPIPADFMKGFASQNLAKDVKLDEEQRRLIARFDRIEVKDSKLYIIPRTPSNEPSEDEPTKDRETPAADATPGEPEKAAAEPGSEDMPKADAAPSEATPKEEPPTTPTAEPKPEPKTEGETLKEPERTLHIPVKRPSLLCSAKVGFTMPSFPG